MSGMTACPCALEASGRGSSAAGPRAFCTPVLSSSPRQSPTRTRSIHVAMKKAAKTARNKAGRLFRRLCSSSRSRSQSPAPADRDLNVVPQTPPPPDQLAEADSQPVHAIAEPSSVQLSSQIVEAPQFVPPHQGPILSAESLERHDDASQGAGSTTIENLGSNVDEVTKLRRLPSPGVLGQGPVRVSEGNDLVPYSSTPRLFSTTIKTRHTILSATSSTTTRSPTTSISQRPRSVPCRA